jgi:hypothetical protein
VLSRLTVREDDARIYTDVMRDGLPHRLFSDLMPPSTGSWIATSDLRLTTWGRPPRPAFQRVPSRERCTRRRRSGGHRT